MTNLNIHRIAELEPADYAYVDSYDNEPPQYGIGTSAEEFAYVMREWRRVRAEIENTLVSGASLQNCTHCGAHLRYALILEHLPTSEYIVVGGTCINTRFSFADRAAMDIDRMRRAAASAAARAKVSKATMEFIDENTDMWNTMLLAQTDNDFMASMIQSVLKYGNLTERQLDAAVKAVRRYDDWTTPGADCKVDFTDAITEPLEEGRYEITGEVISIKWSKDMGYGSTQKMLVKMSTGHKVYGSVPRSISSVEKGDTVTFTAKVERKESDFGFFSRPSKATASFTTCTEHGYRDCPHHEEVA